MNLVKKLLVRAREAISDEKHWCKGSLERLGPQYCAAGAMNVALREQRAEGHIDFTREQLNANYESYSLLDTAAKVSFIAFNDRKSTTHADVLAMFDKAIALAEGK